MPTATVSLSGGETVFLGRIRPKATPPALRLENYLGATRGPIAIPETCDYYTKAAAANARMYGNDREGCCTLSDAYHRVGVWTAAATGTALQATDAEVHATYKIFSPVGDNGAVITDVLDYCKTTGLSFGGVRHKILGYVAFDWRDWDQVRVAIFLAGACPIGLNLPRAWTTADVWDVTSTGSVGGHDVPRVGFTPSGVKASSWGRIYTITRAALVQQNRVDEGYLPLSPDWFLNPNVAACGVDVAELRRDMDKLAGGGVPEIILHDDPTPAPPVIPPVVVPPVVIPPVVPPVIPPGPHPAVAVQLLQAHNAERANAAVTPPLALDPRLVGDAQRHCDSMAATGILTHNGVDGDPWQRITAAGYAWRTASENVGSGERTVVEVMAAWMDSPGHRADVLGPYQDFGGAVTVAADGTSYWTAVFASPAVPSPTPVPTPTPTPIPTPTPVPPTPAPAPVVRTPSEDDAVRWATTAIVSQPIPLFGGRTRNLDLNAAEAGIRSGWKSFKP